MAIPVLGRLTLGDYQRLVATWVLILCELIVRQSMNLWSSLSLPFNWSLLAWLGRRLELIFPASVAARWQSSASRPASQVHPLARIQNTVDMGRFWGYQVEEYLARTEDGHLLGLHRIISRNRKPGEFGKPVLMWHGFMMNSEVWLAHPGAASNNLALRLADLGYDVWLGNVRGNKYSMKHGKLKPADIEFWDFSLDDLALVDLPTAVDYILDITRAKSLTYIGFSQGTTICFAALSLLPALRQKLNLMVAVAPSTKPHGLSNSFISSAVKSSPELIFLIFGRRALLASVHFYQSVVSPFLYASIIDTAVGVLFGWKSASMSIETKAVVYQHLYSLCSVKLMVHWFQIIREGRFQMYDDLGRITQAEKLDLVPPLSPIVDDHDISVVLRDDNLATVNIPNKTVGTRQRSVSSSISRNLGTSVSHVPPRFPTEQLRYRQDDPVFGPPMALFYGGSDSLLDMRALLNGLRFPLRDINLAPSDITQKNGVLQESFVLYDKSVKPRVSSDDSPVVFLKCVPSYEHLCFLWAENLKSEVYPDIIELVDRYNK
eukprot:Partr_v1_DN28210_c2_g1_i3_m76385 putative triglyceride lipase-cholesterol esterase